MQVVNVLYMLLTSNNLPNRAKQKRQSLIDKEQVTRSYYSRHELQACASRGIWNKNRTQVLKEERAVIL